MPIFPKCANIGAVFWATVSSEPHTTNDASDTILSGDARLNRLEGEEEQQKPKNQHTKNLLSVCGDEVGMPSKFGNT